jgi:hypothetical protein
MTAKSFRDALTERAKSTAIDDPWTHVGNGWIEDCNGLLVATVSHLHAAQIPLLVTAPRVLAAAKRVIAVFDDISSSSLGALQEAINEAEQGL